MSVPNRQIGQDPQSQMLWYIAKELERLTQVMGKLIPSSTTTTTTTHP